MRNYVMGFKQEELIKYKLDIVDTMILKYFVDFRDSGKMISEVFQGETYYWVNYEKILSDLPILHMKKDTVYRRMKRLAQVKILKRYTKREGGTYSFYNLGEEYENILSKERADEKTEGYENKTYNCKEDITVDYGRETGTNIDNIKNNNTKYSKNKEDIEYILSYLELKTGKKFKGYDMGSGVLIQKLLNSGYTKKQLIAVIDLKEAQWRNTKLEKYIRPQTLFGEKFTKYLMEAIDNKEREERKDTEYNYPHKNFCELEKELLQWYQ